MRPKTMSRSIVANVALLLYAGSVAALAPIGPTVQPQDPAPPVVTPAPYVGPATAPSDALVLFDGTTLDKWQKQGGGKAGWAIEATAGKPGTGAMTTVPNSGSIVTKDNFGDCQLHIEFATPTDIHGDSQERGNSGVYLQGRYEVQVLDSFNNATYPNGQCGAVYGQHPPLVNACRAPGEWQIYDIVFHAAKFDAKGERTAKASVTVIHNGVLIQDHAEIEGPTGGSIAEEKAGDGPILLQDHGNQVRYRNIWLRKL